MRYCSRAVTATIPPLDPSAGLDATAVARWPVQAAAHLLGAALVGAILVALPAAPSDLDRHQLPKETVVHVATWLAVVLARPFARPASARGLVIAGSALVVWSLVSATAAVNPFLAVRAVALTVTGLAALATARRVAAAGHGVALVRWIVLAAVLAAGTGLAQAQGVDSVLFATARAPGGTLGNRNFLGHLMAIALPLAAWVALSAERGARAVVAMLAIVPMVSMLVLTRSRAAWLAALAAGGVLGVAGWLAHRRGAVPVSRRRTIGVGVAMLAGIVAAIAIPNDLSWRSDAPYAETLGSVANYREGSGAGRLVQYRRSLRLLAEDPLRGVGPGNWPLRYGDVAPASDPSWAFNDDIPLNPWPSSDWVALATERGIPGLLAGLGVGAMLLWAAWRGVRAGGDRGLAGATLAAVLAATLVAGLFDAVLLLAVPTLAVALAVGALCWSSAPAPPGPDVSSRGVVSWLAAALLALAAARSAQQTLAYAVAGEGRARRELAWAARIDPFSYPIRIALARREPCRQARNDIRAALRLAPTWPAAQEAGRRCGERR